MNATVKMVAKTTRPKFDGARKVGEPMAKDNKEESIFDINKLRELIELMQDHELNEVDLKQADKRIRMRRGGEMPVAYAQPPIVASAGGAAPAAAGAPEQPDNAVYILSEAVGTFYSKSKPDKPPFVKVGDTVSEDTIVCLIEAMKMFNEVTAGVSGKIVEVMVKDGESVDHGKPLFRIEP
jgi:acetyl-CoA carboxylase biotin carboxyl carrier protein